MDDWGYPSFRNQPYEFRCFMIVFLQPLSSSHFFCEPSTVVAHFGAQPPGIRILDTQQFRKHQTSNDLEKTLVEVTAGPELAWSPHQAIYGAFNLSFPKTYRIWKSDGKSMKILTANTPGISPDWDLNCLPKCQDHRVMVCVSATVLIAHVCG